MTPFQTDHLLKDFCTFGIGGKADFFVTVTTIVEMQEALKTCNERNIPFMILGKGSNCLFDDRGFKGLVIQNKIAFLEELAPNIIHVGAGYSFSLLGAQTAKRELTGLEFASGIPGSVGGAVFMNAGANGKETCETLDSVDFVDHEGILKKLSREDLTFSYRHSSFHDMPGAIVGATFQLQPNAEARAEQLKIITYRKATQPYGDKSAGCVFRNPPSKHAGALIEEIGLKGLRVGGAEVSPLHGNFIVNTDQATSEDVQALIELVRKKIQEQTGTTLESEIRIIPYEPF